MESDLFFTGKLVKLHGFAEENTYIPEKAGCRIIKQKELYLQTSVF
jgi:hypothetical protein